MRRQSFLRIDPSRISPTEGEAPARLSGRKTIEKEAPLLPGSLLTDRSRADLKGMIERMAEARLESATTGRFDFDLSVWSRALRKRFRIEQGTSPRKFLSTLRLDLACRKLAEGDATPSTVAKEVGYDSYSSFRIHFRIRYGKSPTRFREDSRRRNAGGDAETPPPSPDQEGNLP